MLSIRALSYAGGYRCYLERESPGRWVGKGAEMLGLPAQVSAEEFAAIRRGQDPATGDKLRVLDPADRTYRKPWGEQVYKAREMYDLTINAPKTVSIAGLFDERIEQAHREAVGEIRARMEQLCGAMVIAQYEHATSRTLDPQLHTHLLAANLAHDGDKWRTLHANELYRNSKEITEEYRAELAPRLEGLGYQIAYPGIAGIPAELEARFSQRAQQRDEAIEGFKEHHDRAPTTREISVLVRNHRGEKQKIDPIEIKAYQLGRLTPTERQHLMELCGVALSRSQTPEQRPQITLKQTPEEKGISSKIRLPRDAGFERPNRVEEWTYGQSLKMGF